MLQGARCAGQLRSLTLRSLLALLSDFNVQAKKKQRTDPVGCVIALWILVGLSVWWLLGAWPVGDWIDAWGKRHPVLFAMVPAAYGGFLIRSSLTSRRKWGPSEVATTDMRWGVGMALVAAFLVVIEVARWLLVR